jgi:hypothetical protein
MSELARVARVATLVQELNQLERKSSKLCHYAYKARHDHASKDWRAYRKVCLRLKFVKKQIECSLQMSQDTFATRTMDNKNKK